MGVNIGIDIGSTFTKVCVMDEVSQIIELNVFKTPVSQKEQFTYFNKGLKCKYDVNTVTSCGYGRKNAGANADVSELVALAKGMYYVNPCIKNILDVGGQDSKSIQCENGKLIRFAINDKCAAGSGLLLQQALTILNLDFSEIAVTSNNIKPLSSICAVFAQTEIIKGIAEGRAPKELIESVLHSIAKQASALTGKMALNGELALTGGLAQIKGIDKLFADVAKCNIIIPKHCVFLSAIGCALIGADKKLNLDGRLL